ncbi:MAG TPA: PASTA domain-containing protein, partial [Candidatus Cloacimonadota bacterium]|nr:PASTA domain-containing protein [Candidatus Cloacimonadota bacterium]
MHKYNWKKTWYSLGIGFGIIFVTAFIFSQLIFPMLLGRPSIVETPDVVGMGLVQAKRILQEEKLHVVVKDSLFSEIAKVDQVLDQSPKAGT